MKNLIIALMLLCPSIVYSAPDEYVKYAMESPVSVHEFVIYRTNLDLKDVFQKSAYRHYFDHGENLAFVDYSDELKQYVLHMKSSIDNDVKIGKKDLDEVSKMLIITAKARLGVKNRGDENDFVNDENSSFSTDLGRLGYMKGNKPENFESEIDKRLMVELTLIYENEPTVCSSALLSSKILCSL